MAIDRADWHWESTEELFRKQHNITGELTEEQVNLIWFLAANHIGLFVKWIIERGMEGEDADKKDCDKVRNGQMSGTEYLFKNCDGKLWEEDIRADSLPFIEFYYSSNDYYNDYGECCLDDNKPCFGVISDENDYIRLSKKIDEAYMRFVQCWDKS